jgi:DSF synthase
MPVHYDELYDIIEHWVDTAMQLSEKNRRLMSYFSRAQAKRQGVPVVNIERRHDELRN